MAAMIPEEIIRRCRHTLGGSACTACISTALDEARVAAVTAYASGHSHVCSNGKLKPYGEAMCKAVCGTKPRRSIREQSLMMEARMGGWEAAKKAAVEVLLSSNGMDYGDVEDMSPPESWSRLYETEGGEITG